MEKLKYLQEYNTDSKLLTYQKTKLNTPRVQALSKRSRHSNISVFMSNQIYYEVPVETIRAHGFFFHFQTKLFQSCSKTIKKKQVWV